MSSWDVAAATLGLAGLALAGFALVGLFVVLRRRRSPRRDVEDTDITSRVFDPRIDADRDGR